MPKGPSGKFLVLTEGLFGVRMDFAPSLAKAKLLAKNLGEFQIFRAKDDVIHCCDLAGRKRPNAGVQRRRYKAEGGDKKRRVAQPNDILDG